jgi:hypothetical protein
MTKDEWYDNLEVTTQLTADNLVRLKTTNGLYVNMYGIDGMTVNDDPILYLSNASLFADNDVYVCGSITSTTDFDGGKQSGGGALLISHGWLGSATPPPAQNILALTPPLIKLTTSDTLIKTGSTLPTVEDGMTNQPGQIFYHTGPNRLMIWTGTEWITSEEHTSGYYDTLFLVKQDGFTSANLDVGDLTVHGSVTGLVVADGYPVRPEDDDNSSVGDATHMFNAMFTRNLIIGNNDVTPTAQYLTFSIDETGTNLIVNSSSTVGSIQPAQYKVIDLGKEDQRWDHVYCSTLNASHINGVVSPITITSDAQPQLTIASEYAAIMLHTDCNLYRTVVNDTTILETDNSFTCDDLNCNGISVNANAGVVGALTLGRGTGNIVLYRPTSGTQAYKDMLIIQTPTDGGLGVEQSLWCKALAVDTTVGIGGNLTVAGTSYPTSGSHLEISLYGLLAYNRTAGTTLPLYLSGTPIYIQSKTFGASVGDLVIDSNGMTTLSGGLNTGGTVRIGNGNGIFPNGNNNGAVGGDGSGTNYYWSSIWGNYLKYHTSCSSFDALDDLALVKNYKTKTETKLDPASNQEYREDVIDPESLSFLRDGNGFAEPGKDTGFLLGCIKALVVRLETLESKINGTAGGD